MTDPSFRQRTIDDYRDSSPETTGHLEFFGALWDLQDEIADQVPAWTPLEADEITDALLAGRVAFSVRAPEIPLEEFRGAVSRVASLMADAGPLDLEAKSALVAADIAAAITSEDIANALLGLDAFASNLSERLSAADTPVPVAVVAFVLQSALSPFFREAAAEVKRTVPSKFDWLRWDSGLCPACGSPASSARVIDAGALKGDQRFLYCSLCRIEWPFQRLRCARCGTISPTKLHYVHDELDPGHRIHLCDQCRGYLKTTFERDLKRPAIPVVEEVVALPLENAARAQGFTPLGEETAETAN